MALPRDQSVIAYRRRFEWQLESAAVFPGLTGRSAFAPSGLFGVFGGSFPGAYAARLYVSAPSGLGSLGFWSIATTGLRLDGHEQAPGFHKGFFISNALRVSLQRLPIGLREFFRNLDSLFLIGGVGRHLGKFCVDPGIYRLKQVGREGYHRSDFSCWHALFKSACAR